MNCADCGHFWDDHGRFGCLRRSAGQFKYCSCSHFVGMSDEEIEAGERAEDEARYEAAMIAKDDERREGGP